MGHPSPKYTAEFKQRAAGLYRERGCTYAELARELGCDAGGMLMFTKKWSEWSPLLEHRGH